ncbi:MAG TPA: carbohydrate ABC transporter permease [Anaerolineales bacterium]|jgi:multiple sugar transport system permease protein|nr:carbohydrate ABC transporter permease [Anaerolineales bacterium]
MQRRHLLDNVLTYIGAALVIFIVIAPLLWLFISSISTLKELLNTPVHWIPQEPTFERYRQILYATGTDSAAVFRRSMLNSLIVASSVTVICVGFGSLAAYSFARLNFAGQGKLMYLMLFSYMLPPIMIMVPLYTIMRDFQLMDTLRGLIIVYSALIMPFAVWIMRGYFLTIPGELEDAARIDGCTRLGALFRVVMPLSAPGLVATSLFCFLASWEEFLLALVFTSSPASKTIPVAISEFVGRHAIDYGMMATGGVIAAIPPILIALLFQRYLISGLTSGAVKG